MAKIQSNDRFGFMYLLLRLFVFMSYSNITLCIWEKAMIPFSFALSHHYRIQLLIWNNT